MDGGPRHIVDWFVQELAKVLPQVPAVNSATLTEFCPRFIGTYGDG